MAKMKNWTLLNNGVAPEGFQQWLLTRKAHDNPRGDVIRDYQDRAGDGYLDDLSPTGEWKATANVCYEARREIRRLVAEWRRECQRG
jgi:hypothetical protein